MKQHFIIPKLLTLQLKVKMTFICRFVFLSFNEMIRFKSCLLHTISIHTLKTVNLLRKDMQNCLLCFYRAGFVSFELVLFAPSSSQYVFTKSLPLRQSTHCYQL